MNKKILLVLTGGTICSFKGEGDKLNSRTDEAKRLIIEKFRSSGSVFCDAVFEEAQVLDVLSENMTLSKWDVLLSFFKGIKNPESYRGVIILHGTDTLAYTASLLSLTLGGLGLPVCLVSSQLALWEDNANGNENFRTAVELIMNGVEPNVYVPYRNSDGKMYIHYGSCLKQCGIYSEDFFSKNSVEAGSDVSSFKGTAFASECDVLKNINNISGRVLKITPYVGLDYDVFSLWDVQAVVHGTYHSETACVEIKEENDVITNFSVLRFIVKCKKNKIPFIIEPCSENAYRYASTGELLKKGAVPVWGMTSEMTYVKTLLGVSMGLSGENLIEFLKRNINNEFVY